MFDTSINFPNIKTRFTFLTAWHEALGDEDPWKFYLRNLDVINYIESSHPGGSKKLHDEFGIKCYGRYNSKQLVSQIEQSENVTDNYGVHFVDIHDHNGALNNPKISRQLQEDAEKIGYHTRVIEAGSKSELLARMLALHDRYGKSQKIGFLWVDAHGEERSLGFGNGENESVIADEFFGVGENRSSLILKEGAPIVLTACSTGANGGFADRLADLSGHEVIGPIVPTAVDSFSLTKDEAGRPRFEVRFYSNKFKSTNDPKGAPLAAVHRPDVKIR